MTLAPSISMQTKLFIKQFDQKTKQFFFEYCKITEFLP